MENKIRELCEKIVNLKGEESFRLKENCKGIVCGECPFVRTSCECITEDLLWDYEATAKKWLEDNKSTEQRKFKVGDKVVLANGMEWGLGIKYRTINKIIKDTYSLSISEEGVTDHATFWHDDALELYQEEQEQSKTYNIIEALKLPAGTKFKITYSDGDETTGYLEKYGLEGKEDISLIIESLEKEAHVTGHLTNATYTVIKDTPLSFFEAVEQADKKRFKIEHELYETKGCHTLLTHTNMLKELNNNEVKEIMLNAKCYLEE